MVSVIVPSIGRTEGLRRVVKSILSRSNPHEVEIIVVGDAPCLGTVFVEGGKSYAESMNRALRVAKGDYLTIPGIANDIEVLPGWLDILSAFEDESVGMAVWTVLRSNGEMESRGGFILPERFNYELGNVDYGGYGIVPRSIFEKVGFMDEQFSPIYCEDCDYGLRVWEAGYKVISVPQQITHHHSMESRQQPNQKNREYLLDKHREWLQTF